MSVVSCCRKIWYDTEVLEGLTRAFSPSIHDDGGEVREDGKALVVGRRKGVAGAVRAAPRGRDRAAAVGDAHEVQENTSAAS